MLYFLTLPLLYIFYKIDAFSITKNKVVEKYTQFRQLNKLVSTQYKTIGMILYVSVCMILKMYWMNFLQWSNNTIENIDKKTVVISYIINGKLYKLLVKHKKGPNSILLILDENNNDISDDIIPYLGPNENWHNNEFKPSFWNKDKIIFELSCGERKIFKRDEVIKL